MNDTASSGPEFPARSFAVICALAFVLLFEYELARASVESMYLGRYGSDALPYAWIAVAIGVTATVAAYNSLAARWSLARLFVAAAIFSAGVLSVLMVGRDVLPHAELLLYVWKDVHIVVLLEIVWTVANQRFAIHAAKWTYGLICFVGSAGSLSGARSASWLAENASTAWALAATLPVFVALALAGPLLGSVRKSKSSRPALAQALGVLKESGYVRTMLALVLVIQVVITLIDYQFNTVVSEAFPSEDKRTSVIGDVYSWIAGLSMGLQLLAGAIMKVAGIGGTLLLVPSVLAASVLAFMLSPKLLLMQASKVASKAMDYSIFRAAKEILYIPLSAQEKVQGKAVIDMFGYRFAKAGTSMLLLGLVAIEAGDSVGIVALLLIGLWLALTLSLVRQFRARQSSKPAG